MVVKGSHLSEETRQRMSEGQRQFYASPEGRKTKEERVKRLREARLGCVVSEETKKRISESGKGNRNHLGHPHSTEAKVRMSKVKVGKACSDETKAKMSKTQRKLWSDPIRRKAIGESHKRNWQNPSYRERVIRNSRASGNIRPNKPESLVIEMFNEIDPNKWAFVGDGQLIIGGKNPDISNVDGAKKLCEVFGNYWHGKRARCYEETEEGRKALFAKYGFSCLVIWERELKDVEKVRVKIREFCEAKYV